MQKHSHPSLREIQRQERENLIIQAAKEVFIEKGYYETSIEEIALKVGVAKGTIYLHFPSKEALVLAIVKKSVEMFVQEVEAVIASEKTVRAKLEAILVFMYTGIFGEEKRFFNALFTSSDLRRLLEEKKSVVRPLIENVYAKIGLLLEEGKANGEFDATIPTAVLLSSFFQLLSPHSYERLITHDGLPPAELGHYLAQIYFCGIAVDKKR
jgi:TetR/AcrR family fatty acid metabolism transcriptional regulator